MEMDKKSILTEPLKVNLKMVKLLKENKLLRKDPTKGHSKITKNMEVGL